MAQALNNDGGGKRRLFGSSTNPGREVRHLLFSGVTDLGDELFRDVADVLGAGDG